ncbi:MAG: helix-turn-helix transcriptional regulator [Saprospiraceae bacterium]
MSKIVTWACPENFQSNSGQTNYLLYAVNVIRHKQFISPYSIKFCSQGSIPYVIDKQKISVSEGSLLVTNNGLEMECLPCDPGVKALVIFFTSELLQDVYHSYCSDENTLLEDWNPRVDPINFFQHVHRYPNPLLGQLKVLEQRMALSDASHHNLQPDVFYNLAESLLFLQSDISKQINRVNTRTPATREELFRRLLTAKEFMHDHWYSELTLDKVARQACLSPYHFHRSFQGVFGQSPMKWFRQLKLNNAKALLASGQMNVTQVALYCGFADVFSFSKAFKRTLGVSPSVLTFNI